MPEYPVSKLNKIKYDSPSGLVNIGKYIPPFEKVENGFGYNGVILEDYKSGKIQCNICGKWFENMSTHIRTHKISAKDYKVKFGLLSSTALKSKQMRLNQSAVMQKLRVKNKSNRFKFKKNNSFAGNKLNRLTAQESKNKFGVCDLQIMQKVIELKEELGKTPTLTQLKDKYGAAFLFHLHKRYGSYIKYCYQIGMDPNFSNFNPKYSKEYFLEKALSNETSLRILTNNESRALYKYFNSVKDWKENVEKTLIINNLKRGLD